MRQVHELSMDVPPRKFCNGRVNDLTNDFSNVELFSECMLHFFGGFWQEEVRQNALDQLFHVNVVNDGLDGVGVGGLGHLLQDLGGNVLELTGFSDEFTHGLLNVVLDCRGDDVGGIGYNFCNLSNKFLDDGAEGIGKF